MTERRGAKEKPAGEKVMNATVYIKEIDVISLGGIVRIRKIIKEFINQQLNNLNK